MSIRLKCIVIGASGAGKTCLAKRWSSGVVIPEGDDIPRVADNSVRNISATELSHSSSVSLVVQDFDGSKDLRDDEIADFIIICFDIVRPTTFKLATDKWAKDIKKVLPEVPIILVGCKHDLRAGGAKEEQKHYLLEGNIPLVTTEEAEKAASDIGAFKYFDSSARSESMNIKEIFHTGILKVLPPPKAPEAAGGCCSIS